MSNTLESYRQFSKLAWEEVGLEIQTGVYRPALNVEVAEVGHTMQFVAAYADDHGNLVIGLYDLHYEPDDSSIGGIEDRFTPLRSFVVMEDVPGEAFERVEECASHLIQALKVPTGRT